MISNRDATNDAGFAQLADFLVQARREVGLIGGYLHAGDVWWRWGQYEPERHRLQLWEDAAGVVAAGWLLMNAHVEWHVRPGLNDATFNALTSEMLEWASTVCTGKITVTCTPDNTRLLASLESHGFIRDDFEMLIYQVDLQSFDFPQQPPSGFAYRHVLEHEFEERVEVHRDAFAPSKFTMARYQRVRSQPGYKPELDLVAASTDGVFAAYCIAWLSDGVGEFEPVGTRAAFRKMGLGRAVIHEGFRRLQAMGAHTAIVYSEPHNQTFYEACGFRVFNRWVDLSRKLVPDS